MKNFLLTMLLLFIPFLCFREKAEFSHYFLKDDTHFPNKEGFSDAYFWLSKMVLLPKDHYNVEEASKMVQTLAKIPSSLLKKLWKHRVYIKFFTGNLTDEEEAFHLKNQLPRGYRNHNRTWDDVPGMGGGHVVLVKIGSSRKGAGHGSVNLELHETAHSLDRIVFDRIRDDPYFLSIWKKEAGLLFNYGYYYLMYPEEFFAESFAMFYASKDTRKLLKEQGPLIYSFIKNLEKS